MTSTPVGASQSSRDPWTLEPLYGKLSPGPGRSTQEVIANQRSRLRGAMVELAAERGYKSVTVRDLSRLAGVSTRTFYKHFSNSEDCFASTYEELMDRTLRRASSRGAEGSDWEAGFRGGLRSVMEDLASQPKAAQLALVESFAVGPEMQRTMRGAIGGFEQLLTDGFSGAPAEVVAPRHLVRGMAAGVMRVARTRLLDGRGEELPEVADELSDWMLSLASAHVLGLAAVDRRSSATGRSPDRRRIQDNPGIALLGEAGDENSRILSAVARISATDGFSELTISRIRAEAGVSRRSIDARFADVQDCFLEAIEALASSATVRADREASRANGWEEGIYRAIFALCTEVADSRLLARLAFIDIFTPGRVGLDRRERFVSLASESLRRTAPESVRPSGLQAEASVAAGWRIAHADIAAGRAGQLPRIAPLLTYVVLAPVLGAEAAVSHIHAAGARR